MLRRETASVQFVLYGTSLQPSVLQRNGRVWGPPASVGCIAVGGGCTKNRHGARHGPLVDRSDDATACAVEKEMIPTLAG